MNQTSCLEDYSFGPQTSPHCRHGLDLTLQFEESLLGLLPASAMIVASAARLMVLRKSRKVVLGNSFYDTKSLHLALLVILRFTLLMLWSTQSPIRTKTSIAAAAVSFAEALVFVVLSKWEHNRSVRPSSLLTVYLLVSLGIDFIRMRTLISMHFDSLIISLSAAAIAVKMSLLFIESQNKTAYFTPLDSSRPPQETSGILNRSVFWWLNSMFMQGYREVLTLKDLFYLDEELSSEKKLVDFETKWTSLSHVTNYRLAKTIVLCLRNLFLAPVIPNLIVMSLTFAQPFLLTALLNFVSSTDSKELGYLIVIGYAAVYIGKSIFTAFYMHKLDRFVTMVRACLVNIIYNQTLRLDLREASGGESLTLMSADVEHIVKGFGYIHEACSNGTMAIVALGLLYRQLGLTFIAPLILSAVISYISATSSGPYIRRQKKWLEYTEQRVGLTSSVISSMQGVKIMGMVETLAEKIRGFRHEEVEQAKSVRIFYALYTILQTISLSGTRWITYTTFGIVTLLSSSGTGFGINRLFTSLSILNIFMERLEIFLRQMPAIASALGCLRRIEVFLLSETRRDNRLVTNIEPLGSVDDDGYELMVLPGYNSVINMKDLSIGWTNEHVVVQDINLEITQGSFTMIIGPVGSGKSTLMQALLGETVTHKGFLTIASSTSIAYCAQTPWLTNKTIQENILGNSLFDAEWYSRVIRACAILEDLRNYAAGDRTVVGSKGITLSGGQKQRIALARAVYSKKDLILLDDIFSGLDPVTEEVIFHSLLGENGILRQGSQTVILATHAVHLLPATDFVVLLGEDKNVVYQGEYASFPPDLAFQRGLSDPSEDPTPDQSTVSRRLEAVQVQEFSPIFYEPITILDAAASDISRQQGDLGIWKYYLKTIGFKHALVTIVLGGICMGFTPAQSLWLNAWADNSEDGKIGFYIGIYSIFFVLEIALTMVWIWHFLIFPLSASSIKLHSLQLSALMSATMAYFSKTDTGVITNRFSQDLMLIDSELPLAALDFVEYVYNNLYKLVLIGIATAYITPVFPVLLVAFYMIQRFYLRTSRQIRFLDLETKSPLYTHFIESLSGLATIRAFAWDSDFKDQNRVFLQASQRPFFLLATIQRWLTMVLDLVVSGLAIFVAILAVELRDKIDPGYLGLALVNIMALGTSLKSLVQFWTLLETSIGAVSRIRSFSQDTPSEESDNLPKASGDWHTSGKIEIKNVTASHSPGSPAVLRDVSLLISPGQHIGICGRSGSGKSSLLSILFRTLNATTGTILLDSLDISTISINQVRANLNSLSQDPFFLRGTIRDNLANATAFNVPDERLVKALQRVGLWTKVEELGGLDIFLDAEETFSHGERQLFCLARALLNQSKILILDEFTSNVDIETDRAMQRIIREEFKDRTIIAVAHRLDTIMDFDKIVVLDKGVIVEEGSPSQLLERKGAFKALFNVYSNERGPKA